MPFTPVISSDNWDAAYLHSLDNTQAHSDYLINNWADSTSGVLTAAGFITAGTITFSGAENVILSQSADSVFRIAGADGDNNNWVDFKLDVASSVVDVETSATNFRYRNGIVLIDEK